MKTNRVLIKINGIVAEEESEIDIDSLDKLLLRLPAEDYIELYVRMKNHVEHQILDVFEER